MTKLLKTDLSVCFYYLLFKDMLHFGGLKQKLNKRDLVIKIPPTASGTDISRSVGEEVSSALPLRGRIKPVTL